MRFNIGEALKALAVVVGTVAVFALSVFACEFIIHSIGG